ncbi:methyltransferase of ATP-grasp peptide maturase system [Saccharomonospora amisosensis]|uniref:Protein-L-isoaspartate O-methyltransferase n=1 Tax=Saccharomonospora amisosensis TaxID=1128677 RepID=A0A7X5ZT84_9PSEU|nr:ATP-grasp peptide maturase system methyltransferase [Saccharomonospora amisosensis]NIJ14708.1 methyltransferase of ATP-grasp peptide maturase system [Saccharomonospora amisosensis]
MGSAARQRRRMVEALRRDGVLTDPHWIEAFRQVPRHVFVPHYFLPRGEGWAAIASGDPGWLATVYSDSVLVTQLDGEDGKWSLARREGPVRGTPTCSSSMPTIMAVMLQELCVTQGRRVLEIGTGTGYNAALLCHRLGAELVSTVDVDSGLLLSARAALAAIGYQPDCVLGDGELGHPEGAPYDRVLATCSVSHIPTAWLEQTVAGGLVLTTLNRPIGAGLVLLAAGEGPSGHGTVLAQDGRFMPMRAHREAEAAEVLARGGEADTRRTTELSLGTVLDPASPFEFFVSLEIPGLLVTIGRDSEGTGTTATDTTYLVHADGSWAGYRTAGDERVVEQGGQRRLWDLVERAYQRWLALGEPARHDFAVTVTPQRQFFSLGEHAWPLGE